MSHRRAIIVGSEGQDGRILYELLESRGYSLLGIGRNRVRGTEKTGFRSGIDIGDPGLVRAVVSRFRPSEIYYLAAFHHSSQHSRGEEIPLFKKSLEVNTEGLLYFLEAIRHEAPKAKLFYAASSHIFGSPREKFQDESTPFNPQNIYGISKAAAVFLCRYYRSVHSLFVSVGILYNHESPYRNPAFVSKRIAQGVAQVRAGKADSLTLGDLSAKADWGYAPDYVEGMTRILKLKRPGDFVVATGKLHTVGEFAKIAFRKAGLNPNRMIKSDRKIIRSRQIPLRGNPAKLKRATGWRSSISFQQMVERLVDSELASLERSSPPSPRSPSRR